MLCSVKLELMPCFVNKASVLETQLISITVCFSTHFLKSGSCKRSKR